VLSRYLVFWFATPSGELLKTRFVYLYHISAPCSLKPRGVHEFSPIGIACIISSARQ